MSILVLTGDQPVLKGDAPAPPSIGSFVTSDGRTWSVQAIPDVPTWRVVATEVDGGQVLAALVSNADDIIIKAEMMSQALRERRAPPFGNMRKRGAPTVPGALRAA